MKTLSQLFPGYPQDHPQTLSALLDADRTEISDPVAWDLRQQALNVARGWNSHFITSPWEVLDLIVSGYVIHPWEKAWKSYALNAERQPILVPAENGSVRYLTKSTKLLPKPDDLPVLPSINEGRRGATWLVVYGGNPEILQKDGVVPGLAKLAHHVPVADIVFYERETLPTLWSIKALAGMSGISRASAHEVSFPDLAAAMALKGKL